MCHHYKGSRNPPAHLANEFSVRSNMYQLPLPDAGFYPLALAPIVRLNQAGDREMTAAQWGMLPSWWKPSVKAPKRTSYQRKCFNARCEDVDLKPTYREAFRRRRCLMPADEFFEKGHYFHLPEFRPFAFAALWERWRGAEGETVESCTLLTTEANETVRAVGHPRMPVVLTGEAAYARWLNTDLSGRAAFEPLLRPLPEGELWTYAASAKTE
ncbi:MAG TPA: SOS response-associated peptidase [Lacipirellulaceae bacterium]|nr:SOS response-associated peptidase [Lacipirellulaceae bacterium]